MALSPATQRAIARLNKLPGRIDEATREGMERVGRRLVQITRDDYLSGRWRPGAKSSPLPLFIRSANLKQSIRAKTVRRRGREWEGRVGPDDPRVRNYAYLLGKTQPKRPQGPLAFPVGKALGPRGMGIYPRAREDPTPMVWIGTRKRGVGLLVHKGKLKAAKAKGGRIPKGAVRWITFKRPTTGMFRPARVLRRVAQAARGTIGRMMREALTAGLRKGA